MAEQSKFYLKDYAYQSHELNGGVLTIHTTGAAKLRITACSPDVLRIWLDPAISSDSSDTAPQTPFQKEPSYAVEQESWDFDAVTLLDNESVLSFRTEECCFCLQKNPLKFTITSGDGSEITSEYEGGGLGWEADGTVFLYETMSPEEHFYGLGQSNDEFHGKFDRRGTSRDMITGQCITKGCVTADIPVTFFLSTGTEGRGYGMYFDNTYHSEFNMGKESDDYYFFRAEGGELLFYYFNGPAFPKIIDRYTELTGRPSMPPLWTLGYIQSKCTYRDWDDMDEVIGTFREKKIPMDCVVIDADWPEQMINFKFDPRFEDKSGERIPYHKENNGVKFMLSTSGPMIKKESSNYLSGVEAGIFATDGKGNTMTCGWYGGELMDFTAPNMKNWLKPQLQPLYDMGIDAWWLDLIEPEGEPLQTCYQGGPRAKIHNAYALLNTKLYYEIHKEFDKNSRPFILGRTATAGIQKYGSATWTGDVYSDYDTLQAHCPEALNTVLSGIPAWTSDTSGFISSSNDPSLNLSSQLYQNDTTAQALLYERWMQFSCFTPVTRSHHVGPCEPYAHGPLIEDSSSRYLKLRYRLLPYIYSYTKQTHDTGISVMRPLIYQYQNDENVRNLTNEYLFGNELLVAPVLTEHTTARSVYFPEGTWIDYDFGYEYEGGREYTVYAPQNRIPVFVRKGSILPMAPVLQYSDETAWDMITLDIYPAKAAHFTSYLDDGYTNAFENGSYTTADYDCCQTDSSLTVTISESNRLFAPQRYELKIHMDYAPQSVEGYTNYSHHAKLTAAGEGWYFDRFHNVLYILTRASENGYSICVALKETKLYKAPAPLLDENGKVRPSEADQNQPQQMPYLLPASTVPCKIQLENYDRGGEGVSYHMLTKGNVGNLYRKDDVNICECTDQGGGYALTSVYPGEWLEYTVNVEQGGYFDLLLRVSCDEENASFHVCFDEKNLTGKVSIPNTHGFDNWAAVRFDHVKLDAGEQVVKLVVETGILNLNYLEIVRC